MLADQEGNLVLSSTSAAMGTTLRFCLPGAETIRGKPAITERV